MDTTQQFVNNDSIYDRLFLDSRQFYQYCFQKVPCITWVDQVDPARIVKYMQSEYGSSVRSIFQYSKYNRRLGKSVADTTIILLNDHCLLETGGSYCDILHTHNDYAMANALAKELSRFKRKEKKQDFEINLVRKTDEGMQLKTMGIKRTRLNLDLFYEDDFLEVDKTIQGRLGRRKDKGIVLLHGLPGTGKTTYLRYLIGRLKKRVIFLSPSVAGHILNAEFMDLLIENPESVLVIEDAENVIMDRKVNQSSSVSNLLNISDGLIADFLNVQIICTFNQPLSMVDSALMRKGRLIAKYEFGKLGIAKAQRLSDHFGFNTVIGKPMTIAEIARQAEKEHQPQRVEVIGFRSNLIEN